MVYRAAPLAPDASPSAIGIVDYGMGNLRSVRNALAFLGADAFVSSEAAALARADAIVLPGVGAFGEAMSNLDRLGLVEVLHEQVRERRKPFLGICLGMQLLAEDSLENGLHRGLGWLRGHVVPFDRTAGMRVPHVGWSPVEVRGGGFPFDRITFPASFYFDHSYHMVCDKNCVIATCRAGAEFVAAIRHDNIVATQFHPEKSQRLGLKLLRNFVTFCGDYRWAGR